MPESSPAQRATNTSRRKTAISGLVAGEANRVASVVRRVVEYVDVRKADAPNQETPEKGSKDSGGECLQPGGDLGPGARSRTDSLRAHEFLLGWRAWEGREPQPSELVIRLADVTRSVPDRNAIREVSCSPGSGPGNQMPFHVDVITTLFLWCDDGSRPASKGDTARPAGQCRGCPRNCKRRAKGRHRSHWATGKATRGGDPQARRPAIAVVNRGRVGRGGRAGPEYPLRVRAPQRNWGTRWDRGFIVCTRPLPPHSSRATGSRLACPLLSDWQHGVVSARPGHSRPTLDYKTFLGAALR
jgi:hypothetical protein